MSRRRILAERATSGRGVEKPTIVCSRHPRYFYVRLPGHPRIVERWDGAVRRYRPFLFTYDEALARVARYYEEVGQRQHRLGSLGLGALGA